MDNDEVKIFEDGKEVLAKTFERNSSEESALLRDVDSKVFAKMGVVNLREVLNKKLWGIYTAEVSKRVVVKRLPTVNPNMFKVVDDKGNEIKRVDLGEKIRLVTASTLWDEINSDVYSTAPKDIMRSTPTEKSGGAQIELRIWNMLYTNQPKTYFVLVKHYRYDKGEKAGLYTSSKAIFVDTAGNELWTKSFPLGEVIKSIGADTDAPQISDAGEVVSLVTNDSEEGPGGEVLYVYDASGAEVFVYPSKASRNGAPRPSNHKISSNGRYLAYQVYIPSVIPYPASKDPVMKKRQMLELTNSRYRTDFWDVVGKTTFEAPRYLVHGISSDGIADVESYGIDKMVNRNNLDLKEFLK